MLRKLTIIAAVLALVACVPALARSIGFATCADLDPAVAQGTLEDPAYNLDIYEPDPLNLNPDGDGIACNNEGNYTMGGPDGEIPEDLEELPVALPPVGVDRSDPDFLQYNPELTSGQGTPASSVSPS